MMDRLKEALSELKLGGVIAFPSEGVWGLGCDPNNESAVTKLLRLKQRPMDKGLILVGGTIRHMEPYIEVERYKAKLLTKWPGPHTWVVPTFSTPKWITGSNSSVAVRVSSHPVISLLCGKFGGAIVSSSANLLCVVEAGCVTIVRVSPKFAESEHILIAFKNLRPASIPPLTSKATMFPP